MNGDGVPDVVFTDVAEQMLEIASYAGEKDLLHAITFKVFERKIFRGVGDMTEPRDQVIGDVDGDGRDDIVLIAHDRILVLRQDPGRADKKPAQAGKEALGEAVSERTGGSCRMRAGETPGLSLPHSPALHRDLDQ